MRILAEQFRSKLAELLRGEDEVPDTPDTPVSETQSPPARETQSPQSDFVDPDATTESEDADVPDTTTESEDADVDTDIPDVPFSHLHIGDIVEVYWRGEGQWYEGEVTAIDEDGDVEVSYKADGCKLFHQEAHYHMRIME